MIYIVGIGPGNKDYIMPKALKILKNSDLIIGFKRAVDSVDFIETKKIYIQKLSEIHEYICNKQYESTNISIIASGDPTFYGITNYIKSKTLLDFKIIPGISSFQYLTSKLNMPWNNAYLGSLHGRNEEFLNMVKNHKLSIWLTDIENSPNVLCEKLYNNKIKCKIFIGENLSYEDEVISKGYPKDFINKKFNPLNIFIVETLDS